MLDLVAALLRRRPDGGFDALREGLRGIDSHALKREVLARLAAADEPGVGFVAADMLGESLLTEPAVEALRRLGPNAEPALIPLLADDRPAMRRDVASLLAEVGTAKAADAIARAVEGRGRPRPRPAPAGAGRGTAEAARRGWGAWGRGVTRTTRTLAAAAARGGRYPAA